MEDIFEELAKTQSELAGFPELPLAIVKRTTGGETPEQLANNFSNCMRQVLEAIGVEPASLKD